MVLNRGILRYVGFGEKMIRRRIIGVFIRIGVVEHEERARVGVVIGREEDCGVGKLSRELDRQRGAFLRVCSGVSWLEVLFEVFDSSLFLGVLCFWGFVRDVVLVGAGMSYKGIDFLESIERILLILCSRADRRLSLSFVSEGGNIGGSLWMARV